MDFFVCFRSSSYCKTQGHKLIARHSHSGSLAGEQNLCLCDLQQVLKRQRCHLGGLCIIYAVVNSGCLLGTIH